MKPRKSSRALALAVSTVAGFVAATIAQAGEAASRRFDIDRQPVSTALKQFASQSRMQLIYSEADVEAIETAGVSGKLPPGEALVRMLNGTGLEFELTRNQIIVVRRAASRKAPDVPQPAASLPFAHPIHFAQANDTAPAAADPLEEVVVTGKIIFRQNDAFGATKMGLPVKDTPQSVSIVTSDLMRVAGMETLSDFYKVDATTGPYNPSDGVPDFFMRGFENQTIRVDGFRVATFSVFDLALFDRYEVVKGPGSTLYGQNSVAGTVNAVSKLPQSRPAAEFAAEGGQFDDYRLDADLTGPLGSSEAWSYRLIGAYHDSGSFIDFLGEKTWLASASLLYKPDASDSLLMRISYQDTERRAGLFSALQLRGDGTGSPGQRAYDEGLQLIDIPRSRSLGQPYPLNKKDFAPLFIEMQAEHAFASGWTLRAHAHYNKARWPYRYLDIVGPFDQDGFAYATFLEEGDFRGELYGGEIDLFGSVELFGRRHTVFLGLDSSRETENKDFHFGYPWSGYESSQFNAFHPDYSLDIPAPDYLYGQNQTKTLSGLTLQLMLNPAERLNVMLGGRYEIDVLGDREAFYYRVAGAPDELLFGVDKKPRFKKFVGQAAVTYDVTASTKAYVSYGESFEPSVDYVAYDPGSTDGRAIPPEEGTSVEVGLKTDVSADLLFTLALFDMKRTHIAQADPQNPDFSIPLGTQRGRGVELGLQGRLLPELSLSASVAWLDARFEKGEFDGLQPANAPKFGLSAFATYEVLTGRTRGLGFGLGIVHKRGLEGFDASWTREVGAPVTFDFGAFTEVDARVFYGWNRWTFSLSGTNLLDEKYYSQSFSGRLTELDVNPPRTLKARVAVKF